MEQFIPAPSFPCEPTALQVRMILGELNGEMVRSGLLHAGEELQVSGLYLVSQFRSGYVARLIRRSNGDPKVSGYVVNGEMFDGRDGIPMVARSLRERMDLCYAVDGIDATPA